MSRFAGKTVLITGASRGIGAATAVAFAAEGGRVGVNYRSDEQGARAVAMRIAELGGVAEAYQADIGRSEDVVSLVERVEEQLGPVDVLVNNAAFVDRSSFLEVELDVLDRAWNVNTRGVFHLSQRVAVSMSQRDGGAIVHLSSILANHAVMSRTVYIATKGAIESLTRAMSLDLVRYGIRVNAVAPGLIATEALLAGMPDKKVQDEVQRFIPEKRFGHPEEIAAAVLFAASPEASYLNGTIIAVDGGLAGVEAGPARD
ncbi:MAG: SDR family NAD(P)-dependent oxidoreductase [Acidimicrobiales bacterium]